jgi:predicted lipoprotein with Yx(FWY)xxD motif
MKRTLLSVSVLALGALATACGGSSSGSNTAAPSPATTSATTAAAAAQPAEGPVPTVATASAGKLGTILTDAHGATLYLFEKDTEGHSNCTGACAEDWMPYTTSGGAPAAAPGTTVSMLATITRADGSTQLTYNAHPLYYYSDDKKTPGSIDGQGNSEYGGLWYTVTPSGTPDTAKK